MIICGVFMASCHFVGRLPGLNILAIFVGLQIFASFCKVMSVDECVKYQEFVTTIQRLCEEALRH